MITCMRGFVVHNELWPWPISSTSFNHEFAIKLLKYGTSCRVPSTAHTVLDGLFPYWTQMIISISRWVVHNDLWPWPISSRSFSLDLAIKLPKYGTSCHVYPTSCTVLDGLFLYVAQMITSMRWCCMQRPLTLTYSIKVIQLWLCNTSAKIWHIFFCLLYLWWLE